MDDLEGRLTRLIGPLVADLPPAQRPAIVALAERIAARRYRSWAEHVRDGSVRDTLRACAEREEEIASRAEAFVSEAKAIQQAALRAHPHVEDGYGALFEGLSLAEQLSLQARAERVGAATWRSLADAIGPGAEVLRGCANLEEENARTLESLVDEMGAR